MPLFPGSVFHMGDRGMAAQDRDRRVDELFEVEVQEGLQFVAYPHGPVSLQLGEIADVAGLNPHQCGDLCRGEEEVVLFVNRLILPVMGEVRPD